MNATVLAVCVNVDQICPAFPQQVERIHHAFEDPADAWGSPEEIRSFLNGFVFIAARGQSGTEPVTP